jgi:hypothetical protein
MGDDGGVQQFQIIETKQAPKLQIPIVRVA